MGAVLGHDARLGVSCIHYIFARLYELALIWRRHRMVKTSSSTSVK